MTTKEKLKVLKEQLAEQLKSIDKIMDKINSITSNKN